MLEWLKQHLSPLDSFYGALLGLVGSVALFLAGRWALYRDRMSATEARRWAELRDTIRLIQQQQQDHEIRIGQTMTRSEITELVRTGNAELLSQITSRMDRTDRVRERAHDELSSKLDMLLGNSIRRREDYAPTHRPHLVDPSTDHNKGRGGAQ